MSGYLEIKMMPFLINDEKLLKSIKPLELKLKT